MTTPQFFTDQCVGGQGRQGGGLARDIMSPSTGERLATVHDASLKDLDDAVSAAKAAQRAWFKAGPGARADALRKMAGRGCGLAPMTRVRMFTPEGIFVLQ